MPRLFEKGRSGNPGGRPKKDPEFLARVRGYTKEALDFIAKIIADENEDADVRMRAAIWICERAYGKPKQDVDLSGEISVSLNLGAKE